MRRLVVFERSWFDFAFREGVEAADEHRQFPRQRVDLSALIEQDLVQFVRRALQMRVADLEFLDAFQRIDGRGAG